MTYQILKGNSLDLLPTLADNSIDAIVTDPPYGLGNPDPDYIIKAIQQWASGDRSHIPEGKGFMGKSWDSFVPPPAIWDECLRVLKPGGHLLAFAGTRTYDLMGISIRMAGFEIRDSIGWVYGSGFPKSLDVSKAIDKLNGKPRPTKEFRDFLRAGKASVGLTSDQIDKELGFTSGMFSQHYVGDNPQIEYPTKEKYNKLKELLKLDDSFDYLIDWAEAEREVTGHYSQPAAADTWMANYSDRVASQPKEKKEKPATPEGQQWQGWGTALKPALEPIVVARKPLIGTVAENVLTHGTGGLNIDASRIGYASESDGGDWDRFKGHQSGKTIRKNPQEGDQELFEERVDNGKQTGRWPANLILDEYTAELLDEQSGTSKSAIRPPTGKPILETQKGWNENSMTDKSTRGFIDSGGASRFFYVAKASKRDRNEGLEDLEAQRHSDRELADGAGGDNPRNRTNNAKQNFHPTVKPTALMQYLVKLVTPRGGTVLDPFTGSGSTGKAAILEGFDFIGIELTEDYWPIIEGRLRHAEAKVAEAKENIEAQPQGLF
jgi:DNA modification methylase